MKLPCLVKDSGLTLPDLKAWGFFVRRSNLLATGLLSAKVEVESPKAFESKTQVPLCPTVLNANFRILTAAFQSLSITSPHSQAWVLTDKDFLTIAPQLEHSPDVEAGLTETVTLPNFTPKYSNHFLN